ncbi:MAG: DUF4175 family protein [Pirellula sp.]
MSSIEPSLDRRLRHVRSRFQSHRFAWLLLGFWIAVVAATQFGWLPGWSWDALTRPQFMWSWGILLAIAILLWLASRLSFRDKREMAQRIENVYPSLEQRLITALEPRSESTSPFLQRQLVQESVKHAHSHEQWRETMPSWRLRGAWIVQTIVGIGALMWLGTQRESAYDSLLASRTEASVQTGEFAIEPGNVELERGQDLLVTARFGAKLPEQAQLVLYPDGGESAEIPMERALADAVFGAAARRIEKPMEYAVRFDGRVSERYRVTVFEHPAVLTSDATIAPPLYANQPTKTVENTRKITVVEGSKVKWSIRLNKEVVTAELVDAEGEVIPLAASSEDPRVVETEVELNASKKWTVRLSDRDARGTKVPEELTARVLENKAPEVKLAGPADQSVSAIQEVMVSAKVQDDFALVRTGISYALGAEPATEVVLQESRVGTLDAGAEPSTQGSETPLRKSQISYTVDLEAMHAQPDQLLSYYFWTEDVDRDGNPRRVDGEMYFAEIRPFEELFRQGDPSNANSNQQSQSSSQSSPAAQQAEELGEIQKKIIAATWNVLRSLAKSPERALATDRDTLIESQESALQQSESLREKLRDAKSLALIDGVQQSMREAIERLRQVENGASASIALRDALAEERLAYEGLLKLRAREHNIVQQQQQSSQSSSQSASRQNRQQQIEQLKLDNDQERFERESKPLEQEPEAEREMRQIMNRLDELARRQKDLNETLRELDLALQAAEQPEERDRLEEELKRLRDEQQEMLRDADELLDRMNQEDNREAMEQPREQMERAREQMQQSSQSLSQSASSQAIASGSKAEQAMEETREELRQRSSEGLRRTMNELLDSAKSLESQQRKLNEELRGEESNSKENGDSQTPTSTLRSKSELEGERPDARDWVEQREQLKRVLEKVQETVTESEGSEPLLAEELYETYREAKQSGLEQRMELVPKLLERGLETPAKDASSEALQAIEKLKDRIEASAASVLGSEEESLRRALRELDKARDWIESERQAKAPEVDSKEQAGAKQTESGQLGSATDAKDRANAESTRSGSDRDNAEGAQRSGDRSGTSQQEGSLGEQQSEQSTQGRESESSQTKGAGDTKPRGAGEPQPDAQNPDAQPQGSEATREGENSGGEPGRTRSGSNATGEQDGQRNANSGERAGPRGNSQGGSLMDRIANEQEFVAPLTGDDFNRWSDALRDVEELVRDPELRAEANRIREAAREMRVEYKRHAKDPQWPLVQRLIAEPMERLRERVSEELIRKSAKQNEIVPIDRDPVPNAFQERLNQYYERLGSGKAR